MVNKRALNAPSKLGVLLGLLICICCSRAQAAFIYSGLVGGVDRGDSASLPALGFKLNFDEKAGLEFTWIRGGIRNPGIYRDTERIMALGYRIAESGKFISPYMSLAAAGANSTSEAGGRTETNTIPSLGIGIGCNFTFGNHFSLKLGLDTYLGIFNSNLQLAAYALGVRNFWYGGMEISF